MSWLRWSRFPACSTTSIGLRLLYSRFDNTLNDRILSYAEFDSAQESTIRQAVDSYVDWHRRNELPRYADFADELDRKLQSGLYTEEDLLAGIRQLRELADHGFMNSPVINTPDFLRDLSDEQVEQVRLAFERREERFRERQQERIEKGPDAVVEGIVRNIGRIGINLSNEQREIVARGLERYVWQPEKRRRQWRQWEQEFLDILEDRDSPGFMMRVKRHLAAYHTVPRRADPEADSWNQRNSARTLYELLRSLDPVQKRVLIKRLGETREVLLDISGVQTS